MTGMLASVRNLDEAKIVIESQIDILDLKDPQQGALGALPASLVNRIVAHVNGCIPVSATIGDIPCQTDMLYPKIKAMSEAGVDIIKVGIFGDVDDVGILEMLKAFSCQGIRIVLVFFAEDMQRMPDFNTLAETGITGAMVDTREKKTGSLRKKMSDKELSDFVLAIRKAGLLCGLAGSLGIEDIVSLLRLKPDYLGFRGALCRHSQREYEIDKTCVAQIYSLISEQNLSNSNQDVITA